MLALWLMTALGQSRHFGRRQTTSGLPRGTDIVRPTRHGRKVPILLQKSKIEQPQKSRES
jgi:hypothetical protein